MAYLFSQLFSPLLPVPGTHLLHTALGARSIAIFFRSCDPRRYVANTHCRLRLGKAPP